MSKYKALFQCEINNKNDQNKQQKPAIVLNLVLGLGKQNTAKYDNYGICLFVRLYLCGVCARSHYSTDVCASRCLILFCICLFVYQ